MWLSSGFLDHIVRLVYFDIAEGLDASILRANEFGTMDPEMFRRKSFVII